MGTYQLLLSHKMENLVYFELVGYQSQRINSKVDKILECLERVEIYERLSKLGDEESGKLELEYKERIVSELQEIKEATLTFKQYNITKDELNKNIYKKNVEK